MITVKITNAHDIIRREKGYFASKLAIFLGDAERMVEEEIVRQIKEVFNEYGIEADILVADDNVTQT